MNLLDLLPGLVATVTFAAFGIVLVYYLTRSMLTFRWARGEGIVCRSGTAPYHARGSTLHTADVAVDYLVSGRRYRCERLHYTGDAAWLWPWFAERSARRYRMGERVPIRYHPRRPWEAVIRPGLGWLEGTLIVAFALLCCVVGGWGVVRFAGVLFGGA